MDTAVRASSGVPCSMACRVRRPSRNRLPRASPAQAKYTDASAPSQGRLTSPHTARATPPATARTARTPVRRNAAGRSPSGWPSAWRRASRSARRSTRPTPHTGCGRPRGSPSHRSRATASGGTASRPHAPHAPHRESISALPAPRCAPAPGTARCPWPWTGSGCAPRPRWGCARGGAWRPAPRRADRWSPARTQGRPGP